MAVQAEKTNQQALSEEELSVIEYEQKKVEEYLLRNTEALRQWMIAHPKQKPPVYFDRDNDRVVWVNREERRRMIKNQVKKTRMVQPESKTKTHTGTEKPLITEATIKETP